MNQHDCEQDRPETVEEALAKLDDAAECWPTPNSYTHALQTVRAALAQERERAERLEVLLAAHREEFLASYPVETGDTDSENAAVCLADFEREAHERAAVSAAQPASEQKDSAA